MHIMKQIAWKKQEKNGRPREKQQKDWKEFFAFKRKCFPADKIAKAVKIGVDIVQKWIDESMRVAH